MPIIKPKPPQDQVPPLVPDGALALLFEIDAIILLAE